VAAAAQGWPNRENNAHRGGGQALRKLPVDPAILKT
jgi:hypothetical protein